MVGGSHEDCFPPPPSFLFVLPMSSKASSSYPCSYNPPPHSPASTADPLVGMRNDYPCLSLMPGVVEITNEICRTNGPVGGWIRVQWPGVVEFLEVPVSFSSLSRTRGRWG